MKLLHAIIFSLAPLSVMAAPSMGMNGGCSASITATDGLSQTQIADCGQFSYSNAPADIEKSSQVSSVSQRFTESGDKFGTAVDITTTLNSAARVSYGNIGAGATAAIENIKAYKPGYGFGIGSSAQATYLDYLSINSDSLPDGAPVTVRVVSEVFYGIDQATTGAGVYAYSANDTSVLSSSLQIDSTSGLRFDDTFCGGSPGYCGEFLMNGYFRHLKTDTFTAYVGETLRIYGSIGVSVGLIGYAEAPSGFIFTEGAAHLGIGAMHSQHASIEIITKEASYTTSSGTFYNFATSVPEPSSSALAFSALILVVALRRRHTHSLQICSGQGLSV